MRKRWSDAQYTGRYLRRTIVHGKGEARPRRNTRKSNENTGYSRVIVLIVLLILSVVLYCYNTFFGGVVFLIAAIYLGYA